MTLILMEIPAMRIGYKQSPLPEPYQTISVRAQCSKCDNWCEYEVDANWRQKYDNKESVWYKAKGHISLAACGCGTIYCERHSAHLQYLHCPDCGSDHARMAMFEVLLQGK